MISSSPEETYAIGKKIAAHLTPGTILCLDGDLGAGKTTLLKGLISTLVDIEEEKIQSPTFVLLNLYISSTFPLCHFDLYRMNSPKEFQERGFLDYFDNHHVCLIEWSCNIASLLPPHALHLRLTYQNALCREIAWGTR